MDTKSKNSNRVLLALVSFVLILTLFLMTANNIYANRDKLEKDNYFQSFTFYNELITFADLVKTVKVDFADYENKKGIEKLTKARLDELTREKEETLRDQGKQIMEDYNSRIAEAQKAGNKEELSRLLEKRISQLDEMRANVNENWNRTINEEIARRDQKYEDRKKSLALRDSSFKYVIRDKKTDMVYSNAGPGPTAKELQQNSLFFMYFPNTTYQGENPLSDLNRSFQVNQWKGVLYVPLVADGYSQIHADAMYYTSIRKRLLMECGLLVIAFLAGAFLLRYIWTQRAIHLPVVERSMGLLRRVPMDIRLILLLLFGLYYPVMLFDGSQFSLPVRFEQIFAFAVLSALTAYFLLHLAEAWRMYHTPGSLGQQWQTSLYSRQKNLLLDILANRGVFFKIILVAFLTLGLGMSIAIGLVALIKRSGPLIVLAFLYGIFYLAVVLPYILRRLSLMNRIMLGAQQMAAGNLDTTIEIKHKGKLAALAHSLNNIKQGMQQSLDNQMKSERLKSELITNVSHDLKTPLTSIVNYVNLLGRDDLTPEQMKNYVDVLERKTDRLKVLIDDLFEASKMASGSVELNIEQVNVASLLNQAIAEFEDKIEQSSLTFRVNIEQQKMYAPLDGKKTWRVFENLISNALKYSMPGTRVYVNLTEQQDKIVLTMKNVSAYEINFDASELMERFKRADESRNTEGSGLGLAIAKSIVDLQGGSLSIEVDGDYFKVIVAFQR